MALRNIQFFQQQTDYKVRNKQHLRKWIQQLITQEAGLKIGAINIIICDDPYLLEINQAYLDHDTYTDIITFDLSHEEDRLSTDIYISIDRIIENASLFSNKSTEEELHRVIAHGLLHLCGYNDETEDEKKEMTDAENRWLGARSWR